MATKRKTSVSTKRTSAVKPTSQMAGLYSSPKDWSNIGEFMVQNYWQSWSGLQQPEKRITQFDRLDIISHSRNFQANISEVSAIICIFGELIVGGGMQALFQGANQEWGNLVKTWLKTNVFPSFGPLGIATDWNTTWQMVFERIYVDGGVLMLFYTDRIGMPHADFVEVTQIQNRGSQKTITKPGRFNGYPIDDGIIKNSSGTPIGFQVIGNTEDEDTTYSINQAFLIGNPSSFGKLHGLPVLASAIKDGYHLMDFRKLVAQLVKIPATVQLVETNEKGTAKKVTNSFKAIASATNNAGSGTPDSAFIAGTLYEIMQPGKHYQKPGGKLEVLDSKSPASEVQSYIDSVYKSFFSTSGFPYHFLISPETIGGAASRGVQDLLNRTVLGWQTLIEKYAKIALLYCISTGMSLGPNAGGIPFDSDWMNWSFTRCSKLVLDASYERQADRNDYEAGFLSANEITTKNGGQQYSDVVSQNIKDDVVEAEGLDVLLAACKAKKLSQSATDFAIQRYSQRNSVGTPPS